MSPTFSDAFRVWLRIGCLSFGGPAAQIALMHREVVEDRKWLTEKQFLDALGLCMLLPGPEAMQLATYAGWRLHGVRGGLAAGLSFILPGALVVLALSVLYALYAAVSLVSALFLGVKAAVLVIVVEALLRIAKRAFRGPLDYAIAAAAFFGIFALDLPFPLIVLAAALIGWIGREKTPIRTAQSPENPTGRPIPPASASLFTMVLWLAVWLVPLALVTASLGGDHLLSQLGWFFSKLAVVTFGGAYAVLAYMGQDVVTRYDWLSAPQMMDGLGLAETTPGPLILVTEFVGFTAAHASGGIALGLAGAAIALWATFAPCFLWIFAAAPYVERLNASPRLRGALAAITAAVVGVIANLGLWFALHTVFATVSRIEIGPLKLWIPELATIDGRVIVLALLSAVLLLGRHWSVAPVLAVAALGGVALSLV